MSGGRPEEGLVMGALLAAVAVGSMPLVFKFFNGTPGPPRALALLAASGLLLMILRPPLPLRVRLRLRSVHSCRFWWLHPLAALPLLLCLGNSGPACCQNLRLWVSAWVEIPGPFYEAMEH